MAHQPVGMLPEVTAFGDDRSEEGEPPAGGGNASGAALAPAEEPVETDRQPISTTISNQ